MANNEPAGAAALLHGSQLLQKGRADVFRQRERTKLKRVIRALVVVFLVDWYLYGRYANGNPLTLPSLPEGWVFLAFPLLILIPVLIMVALPLINGKSPHITVYPEQVESALTDIKGLDMQVDEVVRSLDVFLGYATFRNELGGTPRRGILFEGPPGTGKTYLAKAMAKQAGVPFLFISAPAFQSMWQGMTAYRIRSFFKALRKAARKEGGAIGFIEEIDAIGMSRGSVSKAATGAIDGSATGSGVAGRVTSPFMGSADGGSMVKELLIQLQSFDQPPLRKRLRAKVIGWINSYLPSDSQLASIKSEYHNILLIAATNRGDALDPALVRPGRFDRRLYFDVPTKQGRLDLIDYFLARKRHHQQLDDPSMRERIAYETFGYTPVMIEHLFDEGLLVALREGRSQVQRGDRPQAARGLHRAGSGSRRHPRGGACHGRLLRRPEPPARGALDHQAAWFPRPARPRRFRGTVHSHAQRDRGRHRDRARRSGGRRDVHRGHGHRARGRPRARDHPRREYGRLVRHGRIVDLLRCDRRRPDRRSEPRR